MNQLETIGQSCLRACFEQSETSSLVNNFHWNIQRVQMLGSLENVYLNSFHIFNFISQQNFQILKYTIFIYSNEKQRYSKIYVLPMNWGCINSSFEMIDMLVN